MTIIDPPKTRCPRCHRLTYSRGECSNCIDVSWLDHIPSWLLVTMIGIFLLLFGFWIYE